MRERGKRRERESKREKVIPTQEWIQGKRDWRGNEKVIIWRDLFTRFLVPDFYPWTKSWSDRGRERKKREREEEVKMVEAEEREKEDESLEERRTTKKLPLMISNKRSLNKMFYSFFLSIDLVNEWKDRKMNQERKRAGREIIFFFLSLNLIRNYITSDCPQFLLISLSLFPSLSRSLPFFLHLLVEFIHSPNLIHNFLFLSRWKWRVVTNYKPNHSLSARDDFFIMFSLSLFLCLSFSSYSLNEKRNVITTHTFQGYTLRAPDRLLKHRKGKRGRERVERKRWVRGKESHSIVERNKWCITSLISCCILFSYHSLYNYHSYLDCIRALLMESENKRWRKKEWRQKVKKESEESEDREREREREERWRERERRERVIAKISCLHPNSLWWWSRNISFAHIFIFYNTIHSLTLSLSFSSSFFFAISKLRFFLRNKGRNKWNEMDDQNDDCMKCKQIRIWFHSLSLSLTHSLAELQSNSRLSYPSLLT